MKTRDEIDYACAVQRNGRPRAPWWQHSLPELIVAAGAIAAVVFVIVT